MALVRNCIQLFTKGRQCSQQQIKKLHLGKVQYQNKRQVEEVKIRVPWGYMAGKWWGPQDKRPILCLHGWQESCGSFDPLFSHLPDNVGLLAFDFPGHGHSTRLPKGVFYHGIDATIIIRRIQKYFNWPKISLLGHSMGGITSFMYTTLYPEEVDMLICIDALKPFSKEPGTAIKQTLESIDQFLRYEALNEATTKPPAYTYDELVNKIVVSTRKSVWPESCKYILERIIEKSKEDPTKYHFSRDNRLKTGPLVGMQHADILEYAKRVKCPMVVMKATKSTYFEDKRKFYDVIDVLKKNEHFQYIKVDGTHHVHVNEPEKVAVIINTFLEKYNNVDRSVGGIKDEIKIHK